MSDNQVSNGVSAPEAPAQPAMKSTDTRKVIEAKPAAPAVEAKPEPEASKPTPTATAEGGPPEGDDAAQPADSSERKEQRLPRWMKERLERERKVTEARTREQMLREFQATQGQAPGPQGQPQGAFEPPQGEKDKTLADFNYDPEAFMDYKVQRGIERKEREAQAREEQKANAAKAEQFKAKIDSFEARVGAGAWEDIESSPLNADPAFKPLVDLFLGSDEDLDIAHHLVRHPDEAQRLMALSPLQRVREVAKLAEQFSQSPPAAVAETPTIPPRKTTSAPPPVKTVSGAGKPSVDVRSPDISTADRIKEWKRLRGQG